MGRPDTRSACRHDVSWPARIRCADETQWHAGEVINLSVTGVLLRIDRKYRIGERVEIEIDFLTQPSCSTVVAGIGLVVRTDGQTEERAAVQFVVECSLSARGDGDANETTRRP